MVYRYCIIIILPQHLKPDDPRTHLEVSPVGGVVIQELANRIAQDGGFSLITDYGHDGEKTDTFRVRKGVISQTEVF